MRRDKTQKRCHCEPDLIKNQNGEAGAAIFRFVIPVTVPFKDTAEDCHKQCIIFFTAVIPAMTAVLFT